MAGEGVVIKTRKDTKCAVLPAWNVLNFEGNPVKETRHAK